LHYSNIEKIKNTNVILKFEYHRKAKKLSGSSKKKLIQMWISNEVIIYPFNITEDLSQIAKLQVSSNQREHLNPANKYFKSILPVQFENCVLS